jgi:hypothetical protein
MPTPTSDLRHYTKQLLDLYRQTPATLGRVRRQDRRLAVELHHRGVPLRTVEEAFLLASARRCLRAPEAVPLAPVRSLHYFVPVIEELLATPLPDGYCDYLKRKLRTLYAAHNHTVTGTGCKPQKPG